MLFNSIEYFLFLPIVFIIYWVANGRIKWQNFILLVASYFFYGCWDYRFLFLIILSSFTDYTLGLLIHNTENKQKRKAYLCTSLLVNLGLLFVFKYYNFFISEFRDLLDGFGYEPTWSTLNVILPIGISFYTFQTLSYTFDVFKGKMKPTKSILDFFVYVAFFPQLVAGPIERAINLLPQFSIPRVFDFHIARDGVRQILWGLFKKVVIADNCAVFVDVIFSNQESLSGGILLLGVLLFAFQIYGDFSGYSDIAIGTAKLFGFQLMINFRTPYFSTSTSELWRRWHISLSTYANEYLFLPLSSWLKRFRKKAILISLVLTFTIIGIWHGANWTFLVFGLWNGLVVTIEYMTTRHRKKIQKSLPDKFFSLGAWAVTMVVWLIGMIFFRSENITEAFGYFRKMIVMSDTSFTQTLKVLRIEAGALLYTSFFILLMTLIELVNRNFKHGFEILPSNVIVRKVIYMLTCLLILQYLTSKNDFIYFQF